MENETQKIVFRGELSQILRAMAERAGSQKHLAATLGVKEPYLSRVINGKREPSAKLLAALGRQRIVIYRLINPS